MTKEERLDKIRARLEEAQLAFTEALDKVCETGDDADVTRLHEAEARVRDLLYVESLAKVAGEA